MLLKLKYAFPCLCILLGAHGAVQAENFKGGPQDGSTESVFENKPKAVESDFFQCPQGQYAGRRDGASMYTKDDFVWAVSPRFASAYCMPREYIDTKLQEPIEAIAYRVRENSDERRCSAKKAPESCGGQLEHVVEIYYRHGAFEKVGSGGSYYAPVFPSKYLIAERPSARDSRLALRKERVEAASRPIFDYGQFVLSSSTAGNAAPMFGAFRLVSYYELLLDGMDYVSLAVPWGAISLSSWVPSNEEGLKILVDRATKPQRASSNGPRKLSDFHWVIAIPNRVQNAMMDIEQRGQSVK